MTGWDPIRRELDEWHREKRKALFWWRDDDVQTVSRPLDQLLQCADAFKMHVALSVIPTAASEDLAKHLVRQRHICLLVHGYRHISHARAGHAKSEFGGSRSLENCTEDLILALARARELFGRRLLPVFVPPWNRIAPRAVPLLPQIGFKGLSSWKPRLVAQPAKGLLQVNTHLDLIDWRGRRCVKDENLITWLLLRKLRWRRMRTERAQEPLGILTHHALWSRDKENIVVNLLRTTQQHPAAKWLSASEAFDL